MLLDEPAVMSCSFHRTASGQPWSLASRWRALNTNQHRRSLGSDRSATRHRTLSATSTRAASRCVDRCPCAANAPCGARRSVSPPIERGALARPDDHPCDEISRASARRDSPQRARWPPGLPALRARRQRSLPRSAHPRPLFAPRAPARNTCNDTSAG